MGPFYFQALLWKVTHKQQIIILINIHIGFFFFCKTFSNSAKCFFTSSDVSIFIFIFFCVAGQNWVLSDPKTSAEISYLVLFFVHCQVKRLVRRLTQHKNNINKICHFPSSIRLKKKSLCLHYNEKRKPAWGFTAKQVQKVFWNGWNRWLEREITTLMNITVKVWEIGWCPKIGLENISVPL